MKKGFLNSEPKRKKTKKREDGSFVNIQTTSSNPSAAAVAAAQDTTSNKIISSTTAIHLNDDPSSSLANPTQMRNIVDEGSSNTNTTGWMKRGFLQNSSTIPDKKTERNRTNHTTVSRNTRTIDVNSEASADTKGVGSWKKGFLCNSNGNGREKKERKTHHNALVKPQQITKNKTSSVLLSMEDHLDYNVDNLDHQIDRDRGDSIWNMIDNEEASPSPKSTHASVGQHRSNALLLPLDMATEKEEDEDNKHEPPFLQERSTRTRTMIQTVDKNDNDNENINRSNALEDDTKHHPRVIVPATAAETIQNTADYTSLANGNLDLPSRQNRHNSAPKVVTSLPRDLTNLIATLTRRTKHKSHSSDSQNKALTLFLETYAHETPTGTYDSFHHGIDDSMATDDVNVHVEANIHFIWDSILEGIASFSKDKKMVLSVTATESCMGLPPLLRIGCALLSFHPGASTRLLLGFCDDARNNGIVDDDRLKRKKIQLLGAIVVIRCRVMELYSIVTDVMQGDAASLGEDPIFKTSVEFATYILERGVPLFLKGDSCKVDEMKKRSLMLVHAMNCSYLIFEFSSLLCQVSISSKASQLVRGIVEPLLLCIWSRVSLIREQVLIEKEWKVHHSGNTCTQAQDRAMMIIDHESCAAAILNDWIIVLAKVEEQYNKQRLVAMVNDHDAKLEAASILVWELAGIRLGRNAMGPIRYGGIAQTLCKQSLTKSDDSIASFLSMLEAARQYVFLDREETLVLDSDGVLDESATMIVRQACTLLGQKKSFLQESDEASHKGSIKAVEICVMLLRSKSGRCIDLVSALLNLLLSSKASALGDLQVLGDIHKGKAVSEDDIPPSFLTLMNAIGSQKDEKEDNDPSHKILCYLLERYLLQNPEVLLPFFMSQAKYNFAEVHVLVEILRKRSKYQVLTDDICLSVEKNLFGILEKNRHVQRQIHLHNCIFTLLPLKTLFDEVWDMLLRNDTSDLVSSAASKLLTDTIERYASHNSDSIINRIIACLAKSSTHTGNHEIGSQRLSKWLKFCGKWRKALLTNKTCEAEAYSSLLTACGRAMFADPSNSMILQLFGSLIDGDIPILDDPATVSNSRFARAIVCLVHMCITEFERLHSRENKSTTDVSAVFQRLSPLLLLRKLSHRHFEVAHGEGNFGTLYDLAKILARNLQLSPGDTFNADSKLTTEERRLSADIAAVCIPFSTSSAIDCKEYKSGFQMFCEHNISTSLALFESKSYKDVQWKSLKVSLFIGCRTVQVSPQYIDQRDYSSLTTFAMSVLHNVNDNNPMEEIANSIVEVQTGCIEFLATCICAIHMFPKQACTKNLPNLIQELPQDQEETEVVTTDAHSHCNSNLQYLRNLRQDMLRMIHGQTSISSYGIHRTTSREIQLHKNVPARICLLNALSISSQRCMSFHLLELSKAIVPSLLAWLSNGTLGDPLQHPLCVASAMQCLFNTFQRLKSFASLEDSHSNVQESVSTLFQLSIRAIGKRLDQFTSYEQSAVRMASLKLLFIIVSLNGSADGISMGAGAAGGYIPPSDLMQAFSMLNGVANMDENEDVRKLAAHLLSSMTYK